MDKSQLPEAIGSCVNAYYRLPKDGVDVVSLLDLQRRLAGLKYAFAVEVGRMYAERNAAEFARKAEFSRRRHDLVSGGATVAKAESEAQAAILPLLETEQKADAAHKAGNLILESLPHWASYAAFKLLIPHFSSHIVSQSTIVDSSIQCCLY